MTVCYMAACGALMLAFRAPLLAVFANGANPPPETAAEVVASGSPLMVAMLGEGHMVDSRWRLFLTEWAHQGADMGLWKFRPERTSCVGTVANILRSCQIPVTATTALGLHTQLSSLSGRYGIERVR